MADQTTPRQMVKALVRGETLARPLLLPVVFSLGSRLENMSLPEFLKNPTKITNALRQIRSTLKIDGLACYWDPLLEVEALGGKFEWSSGGSAALVNGGGMSADELRRRVEAAGGTSRMGRIRVAVEVLRRLKVMLKDEPALMVRVTGLHTLATQLTAPFDISPSRHLPPDDMLEFVAEVTTSLVKDYLEAGADMVFLTESSLPTNSPEDFERWRDLLNPVVNMIRFFEALPVLMFEHTVSFHDQEQFAAHSWDCAICLPMPAENAPDWLGVSPCLGVSMEGLDLIRPEVEFGERATTVLESASAIRASLLTSSDLPVTSDLRSLAKNLATMRGHIARGTGGIS